MSNSEAETPKPGWRLLVVLVLLVAFATRITRIDHQSLWYDEGSSARLAERSVGRIAADAANDIHPPGYYVLLAGWDDIAGRSELSLRVLSTFFSLLAVATVYAVGLRFFDKWVGLVSALFAALNPFQIWYAQEARMYALLGLLSAASVLLAAEVLTIPGEMASGRFRRKRAAALIGGFVLVNAAGLYTHYTFPFILLAESLIFLIWLMGQNKKLHGVITWGLLMGGSLLLYGPWLSNALRSVFGWPRLESQAVTLSEMAGVIAYGRTVPPEQAEAGLIPLVLLALVGFFPPVEADSGRYLRFHERLGLVALWLLVPIAVPMSMGVVRAPYLKFFVPVNLALLVLAARGMVTGFRLSTPTPGSSSLNRWLTRLIVVILFAAAMLPIVPGLQNLYANPDYARDNYRAIAERITQEVGPDGAVVLDAPTQVEIFTYYYPDGSGVVPLPVPGVDTEAEIDRLLATHDRIYAVFWGEAEQDPGRTVEAKLNAEAFMASSQWYGQVRLVTYVVPAEAARIPDARIDAQMGEDIALEGYALSSRTLSPGEALAVTLFWQTEDSLEDRYKVFVHLYGPDGSIVAQHDSEPGGGLRMTDSWEPGEAIVDNHGLLLPADAPIGTYTLMIGMYGFDGDRLPVESPQAAPDNRLNLTEIGVVR